MDNKSDKIYPGEKAANVVRESLPGPKDVHGSIGIDVHPGGPQVVPPDLRRRPETDDNGIRQARRGSFGN